MNTKQFGLIAVILISFIPQVSQADVPYTACSSVFSPDKLRSLETKLTPEEMAHLLRIGEEISVVPEILNGLQYNDNFSVSHLDGESPVNIRFIDKPSESLSIYRTNPSNPPVLVVGLPSQQAPKPKVLQAKEEVKPVVEKTEVTNIPEISEPIESTSPETNEVQITEGSKPKNIRHTFKQKQYSYEKLVIVVEGISKAVMRWRNRNYTNKSIQTPKNERKALNRVFLIGRALVKEYRSTQTLSRESILKYGNTVKKLIKAMPQNFSNDHIKKELNISSTQFGYSFTMEKFVFTSEEGMISGATYRSNLFLLKVLDELFPTVRRINRSRNQNDRTPLKKSEEAKSVTIPKFTSKDLAEILRSFPLVFTETHSIAAKIESNLNMEILNEDILKIKSAISKLYAFSAPTEILLFGGSKLLKNNQVQNGDEILFSAAELHKVHGFSINIFVENLKFLAKHPELLVDVNGKPHANFSKIFEKFVSHYGLDNEYYEFIDKNFDADKSMKVQIYESLIWLNNACHNKFSLAISKGPTFAAKRYRAIAIEKLYRMPEFSGMAIEDFINKVYLRIYTSKLLTINIDQLIQQSQPGITPNDIKSVWIVYLQPYLIDAYLRSVQ